MSRARGALPSLRPWDPAREIPNLGLLRLPASRRERYDDRTVSRIAILVGVALSAVACEPEEELNETAAMDGAWAGRWTASGLFIRTPQRSSPLELEIESTRVVRGSLSDESFELTDRRELFDGRINGQVYDEGDGLFRTNLELDFVAYDLGFMLSGSGDRAVVANFGLQVGALQRASTIPSPEPSSNPAGSWEGRFVALDQDNVDEANVTVSSMTLDCGGSTCDGTRGTTAFTLTITEVGGGVWAASVAGLSPSDDATQVRAVMGPDGEFLAMSFCADDPGVTGFYCAYAALERSGT